MTEKVIDKVYIDGAFVTPHGAELFDLFNPATGKVIGQVRLADEVDADTAVAAAKRALPALSSTTTAERIDALGRLRDAVAARRDELLEAVIVGDGAPVRNAWMADSPLGAFGDMIKTLEGFEFTRRIGTATVEMAPVGVAALISPWNSDAFFIADKLATALAAGCTVVIKPSEMSAAQTSVMTRAIYEAGLLVGVINIVTGLGEVVGTALTRHPDVAKISLHRLTGRPDHLARGRRHLQRVTLELGGKSPSIILDDADLDAAVVGAFASGFVNSGQSCVSRMHLGPREPGE